MRQQYFGACDDSVDFREFSYVYVGSSSGSVTEQIKYIAASDEYGLLLLFVESPTVKCRLNTVCCVVLNKGLV